MSWLLDADVLSQPAKKRGDARVIAWLEAEQDNCYTSSIVIAQLAFWVRSKQGRQREALESSFPGGASTSFGNAGLGDIISPTPSVSTRE